VNENNFKPINAFLAVGLVPLSFLANLLLVIAFIKYPNIRKFPGEIILIISISEIIQTATLFIQGVLYLLNYY